MINSVTNSSAYNIGQPGQTHASLEQVNQFAHLLKTSVSALQTSNPSLTNRPEKKNFEQGSVIEETAFNVHKAEYALGRLEVAVKQNLFDLKKPLDMEGGLAKAVAMQKFTSATYFVSVGQLQNVANDTAEEVTAITKGR